MRTLKLQSATEYLMTYSWAILIIALAIAALFAIGIFKPVIGTQCILPGGLACTNIFMAANGLLTINILQATTAPINVSALGCNKNNSITHMYNILNPPSNQIKMQIGANYTFNVECWAGGSTYNAVYSQNTIPIGSTFTGYVVINYTESVSGFPHTIIGQVGLSVT